MGAPKLPELPANLDAVDYPSYAAVIGFLCEQNKNRVRTHFRRAYTIPLPEPKPQHYATVELDYVGDFSNDKDPIEYAVSVLGWE